jgi:hypothetical protein
MVIVWILFGIAAAVVATNKGRNGFGWFLLGILLGPFGFILSLIVSKNQPVLDQEALSSGSMKKCPFCAELIKAEANKCRFCGADIPQNQPTAASDATSSEQTSTESTTRFRMNSLRKDK